MSINKTLFEKLTRPGRPADLRESVIANIDRILHSSGFLDADTDYPCDPGKVALSSIYRIGLPFIVDQAGCPGEQQQHYRLMLRKVLLMFEPRLKDVKVLSLAYSGYRARCKLDIELIDDKFEQEFMFVQP